MKHNNKNGVIFHHHSVNEVLKVAQIVFCRSADAASVVLAVVANL